ncbi:hypothetical protein U1Q18_041510 [Sarracenia purpurea var. burkii]
MELLALKRIGNDGIEAAPEIEEVKFEHVLRSANQQPDALAMVGKKVELSDDATTITLRRKKEPSTLLKKYPSQPMKNWQSSIITRCIDKDEAMWKLHHIPEGNCWETAVPRLQRKRGASTRLSKSNATQEAVGKILR